MNLDFQTVSLALQIKYRKYLQKCPQVGSEYSFVNIFGWRDVYGLQWAEAENLVWLRQTLPKTYYWAPVGDWNEIDWPSLFPSHLQPMGKIIRVPEALAGIWQSLIKDNINVGEDRDQFDYLYPADDLRNLKGNRFHKKKNLVNQFVKSYDFTYSEMDQDLLDRVKDLQNNWCTWRECDSDRQLSNENQAVFNVLAEWNHLLGVSGGCLMVDNHMVGYTIGEVFPPNLLVIHFEKGNPRYKGVYQAVNQMFVASQPSEILWINREQDLGDPGLRRAKLSYHPTRFLKKYRISFNKFM